MPQEYKMHLDELGLKYKEHTDLPENIKDADIVYMTRVQRERFSDPMEYEKVKNAYILRNGMLEGTKPTMRVLHPLPRVNEKTSMLTSRQRLTTSRRPLMVFTPEWQ
jgi:aspartate carbamoyltransferase catalytic subunit